MTGARGEEILTVATDWWLGQQAAEFIAAREHEFFEVVNDIAMKVADDLQISMDIQLALVACDSERIEYVAGGLFLVSSGLIERVNASAPVLEEALYALRP